MENRNFQIWKGILASFISFFYSPDIIFLHSDIMALNKQIAMTPVHHKPYKEAAFGVSDEAWIPKRSSWLAKFLCVYKLLFKPCE